MDYIESDFKNYKIIRQLGEGSNGSVYEVTIPGSDITYALKIIVIDTEDKYKEFKELYLQRENEIAENIRASSHLNLVTIFKSSLIPERKSLEIFMEHCDDSLDSLLKENTYEEKDAALILRDLISGMK